MQRRIIIVLVLHLLVCSAGRCGESSEAGLGQSGTLNPAEAHGSHLLEVRWTLNEGLPWEEQRWPHKEKKNIIRMRERNAGLIQLCASASPLAPAHVQVIFTIRCWAQGSPQSSVQTFACLPIFPDDTLTAGQFTWHQLCTWLKLEYNSRTTWQ